MGRLARLGNKARGESKANLEPPVKPGNRAQSGNKATEESLVNLELQVQSASVAQPGNMERQGSVEQPGNKVRSEQLESGANLGAMVKRGHRGTKASRADLATMEPKALPGETA